MSLRREERAKRLYGRWARALHTTRSQRQCAHALGTVRSREGRSRQAALRAVLVVPLLAVVIELGLADASAWAAVGHKFLSSLSEAPIGTKLEEPGAVAVDHTIGDVFVADPGSGAVDVFSSTGAYLTRFGESLEPDALAVDEASGDVYVAEPVADVVLVFKPDGSGGYGLVSEWSGEGMPDKKFGEVLGVAVDNSTSASDPSAGDVYVVDREDPETDSGAVDVFKPKPEGTEEAKEGGWLRRLTGAKLQEPNGAAVSAATGKVYVADSVVGAVYEFSAAGALEGKIKGSGSPHGSFLGKEGEEGNVRAIALDETTGNLLVAEAERHVVSEFNAGSEWVGWITGTPSGALGEPLGVAVASSGDVYVGDAGLGVVDVFAAGVIVPDTKTSAASKLTRTTAVLNGVIDGDGKPVQYDFEWGTTEALGSSTPLTSAGVVEEKVSTSLSELQAGTTYYFRLSGENANGSNIGAIREFTTPPAVEALSTGPVQNLTQTGATLTGSLTPGGVEASYYFEWGPSTSYGRASPEPPGNAGSGSEPFAAKAELGGLLSPNTSYHYRLVGTNSFGTTFGQDERFTTPGPPRITSEATGGISHETATIKAKVDPDELATVYHFEYGETSAYGTEVPLGGAGLGSGSEAVGVSAGLTELKLGVTYHFRVVASNSDGTTYQPDQTFATVASAPIEASYATEVRSTEALLHTLINPLGHDTTYYFQYGTESCSEHPASCTNVPAPPGEDIGTGTEGVAESIQLSELRPHTTYYYRVLAMNSLGISEGAQQIFTTEPETTPLALADNRAWEMVTPPNKHGAPVEALTREGGLILASEDGDALAYVVNGALAEEAQGNRSPEMQQVIATRTGEGWSSQDIVTPNGRAYGVAPGSAPEYQFFSPDLSMALAEPFGPEPPLSPEATQKTIYLRDDASGSYLPLVTEANVPAGTRFGGQIHFVNATADLTHVLIQSTVPLTEAPSGDGLYEWAAGRLQFVSLLPDGTPAPASSLGFGGHVIAHAISSDGSRVIWEDKAEGTALGHLYMRDTITGETIRLDAAQGVAEAEGSAQFQAASSDGSKVLFTDKQRLTPDSTAEPTLGKVDLYECEVAEVAGHLACHLKDLTVDRLEGEHAAVQGLLFGVSEDGSSAYLVAQGVLAENENGNRERAEAGKDNLYVLHESAGAWTSTFIATLSSEDSPEWEGSKIADPAFVTARVSPNGRYLAFMSAAPITGYDNVDANSAKRDEEVYLYDSLTASLRCVSCNPTGARPAGVLDTVESGEGLGLLVDRRKVWGEAGHEHWLAGNIPGWTAQSIVSALFQSRYLSDEGRLFFNSPDDLVPQASNGKEDVYEYEPAGVGSCQSPSGGCVSLISSGTSTKESAFLEATPSGNDVFFLTAAQLLPQDTDTAFDIYDARVCTLQSPCLTPPEASEHGCTGTDACRPAPPAQPIPGAAPLTASFSGPGSSPPKNPAAKQESKGAKQAKPLTAAQKLAKALASCRKQHAHSKKKRKICEARARKLFDPKHSAGAKHRKKSSAAKSSGDAPKSSHVRAVRTGR